MHPCPRIVLVFAGLLLFHTGCNQRRDSSRTAARSGDGQLISDGVHGGGDGHFFFLPPLVGMPQFSGTFDSSVSPVVTVCQLSGSRCGPAVAQFSMTAGTGSEVVRLDLAGGQYVVNWHTDQCVGGPCTLPTTSAYRIRVSVGVAELGYADVALVANAAQAKNVDTNQFIALVDGRTLPIKFRVERGAITVLPASGGTASIGPAGGIIATGDGAMALAVPPGALPGAIDISVAQSAGSPGATGILAPVWDFQPDGTSFSSPATLTFKESGPIPGGEAEDQLVIESLDHGSWTEIPGSVVDAYNHTVTAPIAHFSGKAPGVKAASVTITPASAVLTTGQGVQLAATVKSANGTVLTGTTVVWTSSDSNIATVDATGAVTSLNAGPAVITATSGKASGTSSITVVPPPTIASFQPATPVITAGDSVALTASFANGTGVVNPGAVAVSSGVPFTVSPAATTTFTLTVTNAAGTSVSSSAVVTVVPPPTIASFTATKAIVTAGDTTSLTATFADGSATVDNGVGSVSSGVAAVVGPLSATTTWTLTVANAAGRTVSAQVTVDVVPPPAIASFTASQSTITAGTSATLTATFSGGTATIAPGDMAAVSGMPTTVTPSATTTYLVTVTNPAGAAVSASITIAVVPPPSIASFTAVAPIITAGRSTYLVATFEGGTAVIEPGDQFAVSGGWVFVWPSATTAYTLTVTNPAGAVATATTVVTVVPPPYVYAFAARNPTVSPGESTTLSASFSGGSAVIDPGSMAIGPDDEIAISPTQPSTEYVLTVTNAAGDAATARTTVDVAVLPSWIASNQGLNGGPMTAIAIDPADPATIYAGTADGVWKSADRGGSWSKLIGPAGYIGGIVVDSTALYVAAGTSPVGPRVFKSVDGGATFTRGIGGPPRLFDFASGFYFRRLTQDPLVPDTLYAAGEQLWKSTDAGAHWFALSVPAAALFYDVKVDPTNSSNVYAVAQNGGVFKSTDGGTTFTAINGDLATASGGFTLELDARTTPPTLYYGKTDYPNNGLFVSTNMGTSWSRLANIFPYVLALDPATGTIYAGDIERLDKSTDGGRSWTLALSQDQVIASLAVVPAEPGAVWAGFGGGYHDGLGLFHSTDGGTTWAAASTGLRALGVQRVVVAPSDANVLYSDAYVCSRSTDGGATWAPANSGLPTFYGTYSLVVDANDASTVYLSIAYSGVFKSVNGGATWSRTALPNPSTRTPIVALYPDPRGGTLYAHDLDLDTTYVTMNGGASWSPIGVPPQPFTLSVATSDPRWIYAGVNSGLYRSTDSGASFTKIMDGQGLAIAVDRNDARILHAAVGNQVVASTDGGTTWTAMTAGFPPNTLALSLVLGSANDGTVYAQASSGWVYVFSPSAGKWLRVSSGLAPAYGNLAVHPASGTVWVGTVNGVYRTDPFVGGICTEPDPVTCTGHCGGTVVTNDCSEPVTCGGDCGTTTVACNPHDCNCGFDLICSGGTKHYAGWPNCCDTCWGTCTVPISPH